MVPTMVICGLAMIFVIKRMCCYRGRGYRRVSAVPVSYWLAITRGSSGHLDLGKGVVRWGQSGLGGIGGR